MKRAWNFMSRLYRDERGAEGLEKLLIIAAIVLPLLGLLIFARDWISEWVGTEAREVQQSADDMQDSF